MTFSGSHCLKIQERAWESQGIEEIRENLWNFIGDQGEIVCSIRLSNSCCNIVSDQKRDENLDFYYLFCYFYINSFCEIIVAMEPTKLT